MGAADVISVLRVQTTQGAMETLVYHGTASGQLAVTAALGGRPGFVVTHVATGRAIAVFPSLEAARAAAHELDGVLPWAAPLRDIQSIDRAQRQRIQTVIARWMGRPGGRLS